MAFINIDGFLDELQIEIVPVDINVDFPKSEKQQRERERTSYRKRAAITVKNSVIVR